MIATNTVLSCCTEYADYVVLRQALTLLFLCSPGFIWSAGRVSYARLMYAVRSRMLTLKLKDGTTRQPVRTAKENPVDRVDELTIARV